MDVKNYVDLLKISVNKLQKNTEFRRLAVIFLATALEKQIKNVVIYNYRKSGLSASFVRGHLLKGAGYSELLQELDWAASFNSDKKLKQVWKESNPPISDLYGIMKIRNRIIHSNGGVSQPQVDLCISNLIAVIEKLSEIFEREFNYCGLGPLPKTLKLNQLCLNSKLLHKSISIIKF
jgi:hypothetical protein